MVLISWPLLAPLVISSATDAIVLLGMVGASLTGVINVSNETALAASLNLVMPPELAPLTLVVVPPIMAAPELSINLTSKLPGVPWKLATGTKRTKSLAFNNSALVAETAGKAIHEAPALVEYCQLPCVAIAALVVIAMPANVLGLEPPVMPSLLSSNLLLNNALTELPTGFVVSSATANNVTGVASVRTGASLTGFTVTLIMRVVMILALTASAKSKSPGLALGLLVSPSNVAGRMPVLPPSFTTTVTVKLPFQSALLGKPGSSGKVMVMAANRELSWATVAPVSVMVVTPVPIALTEPPEPPTKVISPLLTVTVVDSVVAPLSSSLTIILPFVALRTSVAALSFTVTSLAVILAGSLILEANMGLAVPTTFCVRPGGIGK